MTNTGVESITFTGHDGKSYTNSFQPGSVLIEKINDRQALVRSFVLAGKDYFYHPANTPGSSTASKIVSLAETAGGGKVGMRYGIAGGIVGAILAYGAGELVKKHLPNQASQEGYYHGNQLVFKGKKIIDL